MRYIYIFLASSNDMKKHREGVQKTIDELNEVIMPKLNVSLRLFRWEKNISPQMGRPQDIIFKQSDFSKIDIFIGILGNRFGTPTGGLDDEGQPYGSGTEEEYTVAYKMFIETGKPHIMIFKSDAPLKPGTFDIEQYKMVQDFLYNFNAEKSHPGLYCSFKTINGFLSLLRSSLLRYILDTTGQEKKTIHNDKESVYSYGMLDIFLPQTNSRRGEEKNKAIKDSNIVYLLSKTGSSYFGRIGNRYRDLLINNSTQGKKVRVLLISPWSIGALISAFAESSNYETALSFILHTKTSQEVISDYIDTEWYRIKYQDVLQGYEQIIKEAPSIELRFIDTEITASVLLTDKYCFFEPYSNYIKSDRLNKKVQTFEVEFDSTSELYSASMEYFSTLWEISQPYDEFVKNENQYKQKLQEVIDALYINNTSYYIGVHAFIKKGNKFLVLKRSDNKTYMPAFWDIPGGSLEMGENVEEAIIREVREETRLNIKLGEVVFVYSNMNELPFRQTIQIIYNAEYVQGDVILNNIEHSDYKWASLNECKELRLINFLQDFINNKSELIEGLLS